MRIVLATDMPAESHTGAAYFERVLVPGLANAGHDVHVVGPCTSEATQQAWARGATLYDVPSLTHSAPPVMHWDVLSVRRTVRQVIETVQPEIVHSLTPYGVGAEATRVARRLGVATVVSAHGLSASSTDVPRDDRASAKRGVVAAAKVAALAEVVTVPHDELRASLRLHGGGSRFVHVPAGVDASALNRSAPARGAWAQRREGNAPISLVGVGKLTPSKQFDLLIRACAVLSERFDLRLDIVGDGRCLSAWKVLAWELGIQDQVTFWGDLSPDEAQQHIARADVCVVPGDQEALGVAILESMVLGVPVVASNSPAAREIVRDGVNGFLVHEADPAAMAARIAAVLDSPAATEKVIATARKDVATRTVHSVVVRSLDAYGIARGELQSVPLSPEQERVRSFLAAFAPLVAS